MCNAKNILQQKHSSKNSQATQWFQNTMHIVIYVQNNLKGDCYAVLQQTSASHSFKRWTLASMIIEYVHV